VSTRINWSSCYPLGSPLTTTPTRAASKLEHDAIERINF
jgi:hypothetical protein